VRKGTLHPFFFFLRVSSVPPLPDYFFIFFFSAWAFFCSPSPGVGERLLIAAFFREYGFPPLGELALGNNSFSSTRTTAPGRFVEFFLSSD